MLHEILLRLRAGRKRINVIQPAGSTRPVLGTSQPNEDNRRAAVIEQLGGPREAPRKEAAVTIDEPLPVRTQTILSHGVSPELRRVLNGDVGDALPASRKAGVSVKIDL